jgi:hypothetical protein
LNTKEELKFDLVVAIVHFSKLFEIKISLNLGSNNRANIM